jgi:ribosomal protein S18 acetylase RimI-like enzyme
MRHNYATAGDGWDARYGGLWSAPAIMMSHRGVSWYVQMSEDASIWGPAKTMFEQRSRVSVTENEAEESVPPSEIALRPATAQDIAAIAALHADSWRRHYRGAFRDSYLDGDVVADRQAVWTERLTAPAPDQFTIVADRVGEVVGFVHMILDDDPEWGTLLDNLHVTYRLKRGGIGRRLLLEAARQLAQRRPTDSRFYLWVLDQNTAARAFYAKYGGTTVETALDDPLPDGSLGHCHRVVWPDAAALIARLAHGA